MVFKFSVYSVNNTLRPLFGLTVLPKSWEGWGPPSSDGPDYIVLSKVDYSSINVDPMRSLSFMHQKTIPKSYM